MPEALPLSQRLLPGSLFSSLHNPRLNEIHTIGHLPMPVTIILIRLRVTLNVGGVEHGFNLWHGPNPSDAAGSGSLIHTTIISSSSDTVTTEVPDGSVDIPANDYIFVYTLISAEVLRSEITLVLE